MNALEDNYSEIIEKKPLDLFSSLDELKLTMMEANLYKFSSPSGKGFSEDILSVPLNREDQQVIKNDCKRTRVRESVLVPDFKNTLEKLLTYYCTSKNILYKQGLNERFGALLLLRYKFPSLKLSQIYDINNRYLGSLKYSFIRSQSVCITSIVSLLYTGVIFWLSRSK